MSDTQLSHLEAEQICRYLCGREASPSLRRKYALVLEKRGIEPIGKLKGAHWRLAPLRRNQLGIRLGIMSALMETDPEYNSLFECKDDSVLRVWFTFLWTGMLGFVKGCIGRLIA